MYMMAMTLYPDTAEHALHQYPEVHCLPFEISKFEERNGHEIFTHVNKPSFYQKAMILESLEWRRKRGGRIGAMLRVEILRFPTCCLREAWSGAPVLRSIFPCPVQ